MFANLNPILQETYLLFWTNFKLMVICLFSGDHVCALLPNEINDGCCLVQITSSLNRANLES